MILEAAFLYVKKGKSSQFEEDFRKATEFLQSANGYIDHSLNKCLEIKNKYLLLIKWETLENHTMDFRFSASYIEWKKLLHHYYEPFPIVEHFNLLYSQKSSE